MDQSLHLPLVKAECSMEGAPLFLAGYPGLSPDSRTEGPQVQLLACTFLARAGERALFELLRSVGEAQAPAEVRTGLQAAELLREALSSWREHLAVLRATSPGNDDGRDGQLLPAVHGR
jgi:hypothetical protein